MNLKEKIQVLKERITVQQIMNLMSELGVPCLSEEEEEVKYKTLCHGGDSYKLYFFKDTKRFHCFTHCGNMDIVKVVEQILNCSAAQSYTFIAKRIGLESIDFQYGFGNDTIISESESIINKFKKTKHEKKWIDFNIIDEKIFYLFYKNIFNTSFYDDGISIATMKKYEICFDIFNNRIIIPHRYHDGKLIAVRCRNLDEELVKHRKYMPITVDNKVLSAPTNQYFFGLYQNMKAIKKYKKVILVESEKAVMQLDTIYGDNNIALALSGSNLSSYQLKLLKELGVTDVIIALDKEFKENNSLEEKAYAIKIDKMFVKRLSLFNTEVIWDFKSLLGYKDSPTDKGKEVFETLLKFRFKKQDWGLWLDGLQTNAE